VAFVSPDEIDQWAHGSSRAPDGCACRARLTARCQTPPRPP
jgi:hypothetical protein